MTALPMPGSGRFRTGSGTGVQRAGSGGSLYREGTGEPQEPARSLCARFQNRAASEVSA
jgi:hypothetical protein